jgi:ribosomal protein S18 acetylase RimI-like enzyme
MNAPCTLRAATHADGAALGALGAMLVALHHDLDPARFFAASAQTARGYGGYLVSQIGEPQVVLLVADVGGEVVGYSYAAVEGIDYMALRGPAGVLYDLLVRPDQRGHGIGGALLAATLEALTRAGAPRVVLSTAERNVDAQRLFARVGFRRTMVEMTKELHGDAPSD